MAPPKQLAESQGIGPEGAACVDHRKPIEICADHGRNTHTHEQHTLLSVPHTYRSKPIACAYEITSPQTYRSGGKGKKRKPSFKKNKGKNVKKKPWSKLYTTCM